MASESDLKNGATTLIEGLRFALTVDSDDTVLHDASMLIKGSRLVDVGPAVDVARRLAALHDQAHSRRS